MTSVLEGLQPRGIAVKRPRNADLVVEKSYILPDYSHTTLSFFTHNFNKIVQF